jgi:hypothetical protein
MTPGRGNEGDDTSWSDVNLIGFMVDSVAINGC